MTGAVLAIEGTDMPPHAEPGDDGKYLPGWFIWFMGISTGLFTLFFVPWATWITVTIFAHEASLQQIAKNTVVLDSVRHDTTEHATQLQVIAATRFTQADGQTIAKAIDVRLDRMEGKIDKTSTDIATLRRDVDKISAK